MKKRSIQVFFAINFISAIYCATDNKNDDLNYDLNGLMRKNNARYENSSKAEQYGGLHQAKFNDSNDDWTFEPTGNSSLQNASRCSRDISYVLENIKSPWAKKLFDSFGKPESGILLGNTKWLGDYNECLDVTSTNPNSTTVGNFRGKYCTVSLSLNLRQGALPISFSSAVCLPDSCSPEELKEDVLQLLRIADPLLQKLEKILLCFCVFTNGAKLLNTAPSEGEFLCLHGIRFLNMSWIILSHSFYYGFEKTRNVLEYVTMIDSFLAQTILQASFSVESFFVLSGFLLTFLTMKEFSKTKGKLWWPYFYFHRYIRLTPMYMILLGFSATVYPYMGSGPYWTDDEYDKNCRDFWWKNLLYINNFDDTRQCMRWSWYLANDMQFFVISPVFLIALWRWPKIGYCLFAVFLLASCLSSFFITYRFDLTSEFTTVFKTALNNKAVAMRRFNDYFMKLYIKPYTRIGTYLIGMLAGYIFFKRKACNAPKHSLLFLTVGWIIASSVSLVTVYGPYHTHPDLIARSFYNALSRICYAAGLSWVIYVCLLGQGGFINSLLSFKLFIPLSRLTYAAYLIHPMIINGYFMSLKTSLEFSYPTAVVLFLGFMLGTYALSLPVALVLESPMIALEKLMRKTLIRKQKIY